MVYAFFATRIRPQKHYLTKARPTFSKRPIAVGNTGPCRPISLRSIRALATLLPRVGGNTLRRSGYVLGLCPCAHTPTQPALLPLAIRAPHRPISLRSIRALATLLPRVGGNTLRRSGYVLGLCPCAHTPTQPALLPLAIRAFVALFRCAQ